jgi:cytochrome c oxidase subunit 2
MPAGKPTTIRLVNPDSSYHMDGGGLHQFAAPALGLEVKVQPKSEKIFTIPAAQPGTYAFYCDVCCGGKENPSMQGTIVVS